MKKLISSILSLWIFSLFFFGFWFASCQTISLWSNSVCIDIENDWDWYYSLTYQNLSCRAGGCSMYCDVQLPNGVLTNGWMCNWTFEYNWNSTEKIRIYVNIDWYNGVIERYYNFRNGSWGWSSSSSSNYNNGELDLSASRTSTNANNYVDLIIETDEDYVWKVNFTKLRYRSSSSSSWTDINKYSSTYISDYSSEWDNWYYKMTSSNDWYKRITNFIKFKKAGQYRVYAEDLDGNEAYIQYNITSSSSSSSSNDDIEISADDTSISTSEYVKLFIETDEDYVWKVNFSLKYKSSSSSSWTTISSLTNSTYVSNYSSVRSQGYYKMTSSDDGEKTLSNLVKFKKTGTYRITATDADWNSDYVDIKVSSSSSSSSSSYDNDYLDISANSTALSTTQFLKLTINTDDTYRWKVNFSLKYRSSTSSSWTTISRTNSTYVSSYSTDWSRWYYTMTSSNYGEKVLSNLVKFKKTGYYQIIATDEDGNEDSVNIRVSSSSSSSSSNDDIEISADDTSISTSEYVKLFIETDEDYVWKVNFSLKYKSSSSSSWTTISSLTNSTYVSNYSSVRSQGYYKMTSSDDGEKTLSNLVKFKKAGTYRITATDTDWNSDYVDIKVSSSSSSSSNDDIEISANDTRPSLSKYINLTVKTDRYYVWKVSFTVKYKSSSSASTWSTISRTSSTYFTNRSTVWTNWYFNMNSSDRWEKTIQNAFKFAKKWYYRITVKDEDWNEDYVDFNVAASSSYVDWFTAAEYEMLERIYNVWPTLIYQLKAENPILKNNTTWINMSNTFYNNIKDVIDDKDNREFQDYDDFYAAFEKRLNKTTALID